MLLSSNSHFCTWRKSYDPVHLKIPSINISTWSPSTVLPYPRIMKSFPENVLRQSPCIWLKEEFYTSSFFRLESLLPGDFWLILLWMEKMDKTAFCCCPISLFPPLGSVHQISSCLFTILSQLPSVPQPLDILPRGLVSETTPFPFSPDEKSTCTGSLREDLWVLHL